MPSPNLFTDLPTRGSLLAVDPVSCRSIMAVAEPTRPQSDHQKRPQVWAKRRPRPALRDFRLFLRLGSSSNGRESGGQRSEPEEREEHGRPPRFALRARQHSEAKMEAPFEPPAQSGKEGSNSQRHSLIFQYGLDGFRSGKSVDARRRGLNSNRS